MKRFLPSRCAISPWEDNEPYLTGRWWLVGFLVAVFINGGI